MFFVFILLICGSLKNLWLTFQILILPHSLSSFKTSFACMLDKLTGSFIGLLLFSIFFFFSPLFWFYRFFVDSPSTLKTLSSNLSKLLLNTYVEVSISLIWFLVLEFLLIIFVNSSYLVKLSIFFFLSLCLYFLNMWIVILFCFIFF